MNVRTAGLASAAAVFFLAAAAGGEPADKPGKKTVRADDGLHLVCETRGTGDTALVFLHGWCCDREHWKHQVEAFAADYRVVALDQAGHGESGKGRKEWTGQGLAADVQTVVKELGLKRVILVGHSAGGAVALMAAKRMPRTVVAVIGVDTLHNAERKANEESTKRIIDALEADFKGAMRANVDGWLPEKADPELRAWILARAQAQDPRVAVELMRGRSAADLAVMLKEAGAPVRCINGSRTPTAVATNKKYADFEAVVMDDVGHFPMLEKPTEFNRKLRDVLKEFSVRK